MNDSKNYGQILLYSFLGGLGGAIPYLAINFFAKTLIGPLYLLVGFSAYSLYLFFVDNRAKKTANMVFVILGILMSVIISQLIFFSFDPSFTKQASGNVIEKAAEIMSNSFMMYLLAVGLYFILSLIGLLITYYVFKLLKYDKIVYKEYRKRNARKKKF
ncbi:MAG: hypothetical protein GX166_04010 [Clostridiaceae bacterium]|nr:hypothetical protein [Clostridiaceae bacterium]